MSDGSAIKTDKRGRPYARLADLNVGDMVQTDGDFTCRRDGQISAVEADDDGRLWIPCGDGKHFLSGQIDPAGFACVGVYLCGDEKVALTDRDRLFEAWVDAARAVKIVDELARRGHALRRSGGELVGPCPRCGGHDRFGLHLAKNVWNCRGCAEGGDAIRLVQTIDGCGFLVACEVLTGSPAPGRAGESDDARRARLRLLADRAAQAASADARRAQSRAQFRERERRRCHGYWTAAQRTLAGTPVEAYLALRGLSAPAGAHLRYWPDAPLWDEPPPAGRIVHRGPAMVAAIVGPAGRFSGLHTTWIDLDDVDGKARVPDGDTGELVAAKKVRGTWKGGSILLSACPQGRMPRVLFLGEGIETVLSVRAALIEAGADVLAIAEWRSGVSLGNLAGRAEGRVPHPTETIIDKAGRTRRRPVPDAVPLKSDTTPVIAIAAGITDIVLLGDGDSDPFVTGLALERAAARLSAAYPWVTVRLAMAPDGVDFNDAWRARAA